LHWAILLMGYGGLRRAEMACQRWENLVFDEAAPVIRIRASDDFRIKTDDERDVPMHRRIVAALGPHRKAEGYVLETDHDNGGKWRYRFECVKALQTALGEAELTDRDPFQRLRRTFGSMLVQNGVAIFKAAQWLGHSVRVCERHYAGLTSGDKDINRI
ncbi:MAG: tyrosine-type recombinase/integrase, partial [bacterium]|nr:tyrosine-type recombinase/integrase [bacterium]